MDDTSIYLPWLIPPLLGALIGYVTNYIAIRMLFRPLRAWRLFGLKLPLTPGIIPAKRGELAQRMGEMVGSHLLTADDVRQALERPGFRKALRLAVDEKLNRFLDRDLGPLESLVPDDYRHRFRELVATGQGRVVRLVADYLASEEFAGQLQHWLQGQGDALLARDLESFLTPERYARGMSQFDAVLTSFLQSPGTVDAAGRFLDDRIDRLLQSERTLRELLPQDLVDVLLEQLDQEVPALLERFGGLLYDPEFRQRLVGKARDGIEAFLDSLGGLAGLLTGFINLEQVYAKIPEFVDRIGEDLARWLREEQTQQRVAGLLRERLEGLLDRPLAGFLEKAPYDKVAGARRYLRDKALQTLQSRKTVDLLHGLAEKGVHRIKDQSFESLLTQALPEGGLERGREVLFEQLLALLRSPQAIAAFERVLCEQTDELVYRRPLGRLGGRVPSDLRDELEEGLTRQLGEVLQKEVPPMLETLNVARMVEQKVNRLDILQVESLLMGVMKEQFKYINLFGALLGFLLGLINLVAWWVL